MDEIKHIYRNLSGIDLEEQILTKQSNILVMQQDDQLKEYSLYNETRLYKSYF